jgi:hypothetical protein
VLQCFGIKHASSVGRERLLVDIEEDVLVQLVEKEEREDSKTIDDRRDDLNIPELSVSFPSFIGFSKLISPLVALE